MQRPDVHSLALLLHDTWQRNAARRRCSAWVPQGWVLGGGYYWSIPHFESFRVSFTGPLWSHSLHEAPSANLALHIDTMFAINDAADSDIADIPFGRKFAEWCRVHASVYGAVGLYANFPLSLDDKRTPATPFPQLPKSGRPIKMPNRHYGNGAGAYHGGWVYMPDVFPLILVQPPLLKG